MAIDPDRRSRVIAMLREEKLDALICSSPTEVLLLTGYWPVMGNSIAIFTAGGEVHVLLPEDEHEIAANNSNAVLTDFIPEQLQILTTPKEAIGKPIASLCRKLSITQARVGMELEQNLQPASYAVTACYRSTLRDLLHEEFPKLTIVAADGALERLKASKTAIELERMNANVKVAEAGFSAAPQAIQEGLRETVVAAAIQSAFQQSPAASRIERNYGFFYCMSGPNSAKAAAAYARTRQRIVEANDLVMIHANTCGDGYWTDITRTWTVSEPTQKQANMRAAIMEARLAALEVIRPGRHARDVDQAARSVLVKHGYGKEFKHPLGHGVGFAAANAKGRPRIHPASPDVLEAGMTFNVEPAIYFDGYGGMRHCDVVAVTSIGVKVMTDF
jgi:Xaa-Pro aminopeptidase